MKTYHTLIPIISAFLLCVLPCYGELHLRRRTTQLDDDLEYWAIYSDDHDGCLEVKNGKARDGQGLIWGDCTGAALWRSDGQGRLHTELDDNFCVQAGRKGTPEDRDRLRLYECNDGPLQKWTNNAREIMPAANPTLCVTTRGVNYNYGDPMLLRDCDKTENDFSGDLPSGGEENGNDEEITVLVTVTEPTGGTAELLLYLYDSMLADAPASLAATETVVIPAGEASATVVMYPDMSVTQAGKTHDEMIEPYYYASLDSEASTLDYVGGPTFGVSLGDSVSLDLKPKEDIEEITVLVTVTEPTGGVAKLLLYLYDSALADAPAALADTKTLVIPAGETGANVVMYPDMSVTQAGKTHDEMIEPYYYVAVDIEASTLTYVDGPAFGISIGDSVTLELEPKE